MVRHRQELMEMARAMRWTRRPVQWLPTQRPLPFPVAARPPGRDAACRIQRVMGSGQARAGRCLPGPRGPGPAQTCTTCLDAKRAWSSCRMPLATAWYLSPILQTATYHRRWHRIVSTVPTGPNPVSVSRPDVKARDRQCKVTANSMPYEVSPKRFGDSWHAVQKLRGAR